MTAPAREGAKGCGQVALLAGMGFGVFLVVFRIEDLVLGDGLLGWQATVNEQVVLVWIMAGAIMGLLAPAIGPRVNRGVAAAVVFAPWIVLYGLLSFAAAILSPGSDQPPSYVYGVMLAVAVGSVVLLLLAEDASNRRRTMVRAWTAGVLIALVVLCHVRGVSHLRHVRAKVLPAVAGFVTSEMLATGGEVEWEEPQWMRPVFNSWEPTVGASGAIKGTSARVAIDVTKAGALRGVRGSRVAVVALLRLPRKVGEWEVPDPQTMQWFLASLGVKPELAGQFQAGAKKEVWDHAGYEAKWNGFVYSVPGAYIEKVVNGYEQAVWQEQMRVETEGKYVGGKIGPM